MYCLLCVLCDVDCAQVPLGWEYEMRATYVEVYNENIYDLFSDSDVKTRDAPLQLRQKQDGSVHLPDAKHRVITGEADVEELMALAQSKRHVASTSMNARSSRSHAVFSLFLVGKNDSENVQLSGSLNLVDLAGSERLDRSQAEGARLKETQAINKSLSCLTDVFTALSRKQSHIPFRNSKLTFLLQKCFSKNGN